MIHNKSMPALLELFSLAVQHEPHQDKLEKIHGIGPVYAQRLNRAGIQSFAQLAELAPEQLMAIVSDGKNERLIDAKAWIEQAQQLAAQQTLASLS